MFTPNTKIIDFEVFHMHPDQTISKSMVKVPVRWDAECEQWVMSEEAHQIIDAEKLRLSRNTSDCETAEDICKNARSFWFGQYYD